jgi:CRP-like cAMP-binding protein
MADPLFARFGREFAAGDYLFREGDRGGEMYVIHRGRIEISKRVGNESRVLAELGRGEFLGEMAILNDKPRTATARVLETSECLVLDAKQVEMLIGKSPEIALRLLKKLAARLDAADDLVKILMNPDPRARVLLALKRRADEEAARMTPEQRTELQTGSVSIDVHVRPTAMAAEIGVTLEELTKVLTRLERLGIARRTEDEVIAVADVEGLLDFLEFLEVPQQFGAS